MKRQHPGDLVESYLENAVKGERRPAIRCALDLFDSGVPEEQVVVGLPAAAQREVGERWHRNELTVADEHIATGVAAAARAALVSESDPSGREGHTVVACAEGDWHALGGGDVRRVAAIARRRRHGARCIHAGRARGGVHHPTRRGITGDLVQRADLLPRRGPTRRRGAPAGVSRHRGWPSLWQRLAPGNSSAPTLGLGRPKKLQRSSATGGPSRRRSPTSRCHSIRWRSDFRRSARANLGLSAFDGLAARFPAMADYNAQQLARTREDLVFIVQFLAAAMLVSDDSIFTEFLDWLQDLLVSRGVPPTALISGLEALRPVIESVAAEDAVRLLDIGRHQLHYAMN